jgi:hypothetical protein
LILLVPSEPIAKIIAGIIFRLVICKFIRLQQRQAAMRQFPNGSIFQKFPTKRSDPRMENETQPRQKLSYRRRGTSESTNIYAPFKICRWRLHPGGW